MKSRMEKYYGNNNETTNLRTNKNEKIYREIHDSEIKDFNVNSNVSVIGDNSNNIDIESLKQILDKKYHDNTKRRSIDIENVKYNNNNNQEELMDEDKDYDINSILEKAYEQKKDDYNENRLKKLRNTQFDILKNLNLETNNNPTKEDENLMTLINTIAENEKSSNPLDILTDLKGDENDEVVEGASSTKTLELKNTDEVKQLNNEKINLHETKTEDNSVKNLIDNSFYTNSLKINKKDFEDFNDLEKDTKAGKIKIIVLILIILVIIFGIIILLNRILNLNLF